MVNSELVDSIKVRFQQGEKSAEIKEALINEGWSDGDIEAAFGQIRHEAYMQIPLYAKIHNWMQSADQRAANLSTKTVVQIFIAITMLFIGGIVILYYFLDPLGMRSTQRDEQREQAAIEIRLALEKYYKENKYVYPNSLNDLVPKYLASVPVDPRSNTPYAYKVLERNAHYEFCVDFEVQVVRCISSDNTSDIPSAPQTQGVTPAAVQYAINGQVYFDVNKNGEKDDTEEISSGLKIKVNGANNDVVCDTITDSSGIFNCNVSGQGSYSVAITPPPGYTSSLGNPIPVRLPGTSSAVPNVETLFVSLVK